MLARLSRTSFKQTTHIVSEASFVSFVSGLAGPAISVSEAGILLWEVKPKVMLGYFLSLVMPHESTLVLSLGTFRKMDLSFIASGICLELLESSLKSRRTQSAASMA